MDLGIKGQRHASLNRPNANATADKGFKNAGSIVGTHYDPDAAAANRSSLKKRPAPVPGGKSQTRSQPNQ